MTTSSDIHNMTVLNVAFTLPPSRACRPMSAPRRAGSRGFLIVKVARDLHVPRRRRGKRMCTAQPRTLAVAARARPPTCWPGTQTTVRPQATTGRRSRSAAGTRRSIRKRFRLISRPALRTRSPGRRVRTVSGPAGTPIAARPAPRAAPARRRQRPSGSGARPGTSSAASKGGAAGAAGPMRISSKWIAASRPPGSGRRRPDGAGRAARSRIASTCSRATAAQPARRADARCARRCRATARGAAATAAREQDRRPVRGAHRHGRGEAGEDVRLLGQHGGGAGQRVAHGGVEARLEVRDQLVADAVAQERGVGVGRVLAPGQAVRGQVVEHVRPRHAQHRAQEAPAPRAHGAEAGAARPAQQAQEHRLRLVVAGVREDDPRRAFARRGPLQEGVALQARRFLDAAAVAGRAGADVGPSHAQRDAEGAAQAAAEGGVRAPSPAAGRGRGAPPPRGSGRPRREGVEQGDGVGAAGQPDHDGPGGRTPPAGCAARARLPPAGVRGTCQRPGAGGRNGGGAGT